VLTGDKVFVVDGLGADAFVVVARTAGKPGDRAGLSLFWCPPTRPACGFRRSSWWIPATTPGCTWTP
jgi:alkylation response protein AidB-like acyl-CoA dehydrogenase